MNQAYLRPTPVGALRCGDIVAVRGDHLVALGIAMPAATHLWGCFVLVVSRVSYEYRGQTHTVSLTLTTRSRLFADCSSSDSAIKRGWSTIELPQLASETCFDLVQSAPRKRRATPTPSIVSALTNV